MQLFAPYGAVRYSDQVMPTDYGFTGQRLDAQTGLIYDNARYYDPVSGRFTRADTVQTNTTGMDPYAYVGNNPESRTDPSGNRVVCEDPGESCNSGSTGPSSGCGPCHDPNKPWPKPENGGGTSPTQPAPASPAVQQVVQTLTTVAGFAGKILWEAIDLVFNFSGMYHDIQTLTDANASGWDKAWALGDLTASVIMDINMLDGAGEAMQAARIGAQIAEKGAIDVSEMAGKDAAKVVEECVAGGLSFVATTVVATRVGEQAIGTLKVGEKVWAYNPNTKKMELQPILHVWINHDNDLVDLTITKTIKQGKTTKPVREVLHTNQKHPFLTVEKGFLPVGQIKLGMHVLEADGKVGVVSGWKVVPGVKVMYNLEVAHDHTFVVGVGMWVVHNCAKGGDLFRGGNTTTSKIDNVRVGKDVTPDDAGLIHPGGGGMSLDSSRANLVSNGYKPWKMSASDLPEGLQFRNDHGTHVLLEPGRSMTVDEFRELLQQIPTTKDF